MDLPLELMEQYQKGRVLVFIGQGINGPEWGELGQQLTDRLGQDKVTGTQTTEEIMEIYESLQKRQALVQFVLDFYGNAGGPHEVHALLARLRNCRFFVTTCIDERFEQGFRNVGRPLHTIVHRSDLAYTNAYTARLYRLYGALSQPESLRLTQEETADALSLSEDEGFSDVLKGHLADSTIVFVGHNLDDPFFKQLFRSSIKPLHRHNARCYAFAERDYTRLTRWFCEQNNIELLRAGLTDILAAFVRALETQVPIDNTSPEITKMEIKETGFRLQPYKRLFSYAPEDSSIFFGRREESEQLLALIHAHQIVVLCGDSGVGKSSLLGAGVIPPLEAGDYTVLQQRVFEPPTTLLRQRLSAELPVPSREESLPDLLAAFARQRPLVIVLDQFEEFFTHLSTPQREEFTRELAEMLSRRDLPVKWVISLRSDYLARLNEMRTAIPNIFKAEFYLAPLRGESAAQAISGPLKVVSMGIEAELLQRLLTDLDSEGEIEPPQLQIVCHEIYQTALAKKDHTLRLQHYLQSGGAKEILASYVEQALRRMPQSQDLQARQVLIALVSGEGLPAVLSLEDVASAARLPVETTAGLLDRLQDEWLVKTTIHEGRKVFELAHTYLAASLATDSEVLQRKAIEELLRRGLQDWQRYQIMLSEEELSTIRNWLEKIELSVDAQKLILRSAIQRNKDLPYWMEKVVPDIIEPVIKEFLAGGETTAYQHLAALNALSHVSQREPFIEDLCSLLQNPSFPLEASFQAALYLARMNPQLALETLRRTSPRSPLELQKVLIYLYNAQAAGMITLGQRPTWLEQRAILSSRLRTNAGYMAARIGTAGLAAMGGGLLGSIAGIGAVGENYVLYLIGAIFVPFVWAASLMLGMSLIEALRFNRRSSTWFLGAFLGNLPLVILTAADPDPNLARLGMIHGLLGAVCSGIILAATLTVAGSLPNARWRIFLSVTGAALAGLVNGLILTPLALSTGIPGFNQWILSAILAGGAAGMMLGMILVPALPFVGVDHKPGLDLKDMFYKKEVQNVAQG